MRNDIIYMDNAATTKMNPKAYRAMQSYYMELYGNPSSVYRLGLESKKVLGEAREIFANKLNAEPGEIYFTSGGTESDNWVLENATLNYGRIPGGRRSRGHIITTAIEHHAIINKCKELERRGYQVTYVKPDKYGIVQPEEIHRNIKGDTILISVMTANNEIGTIQKISEIGKLAKKYNVLFHTDAVQAFGHIPIDVKKSNIDFLSISGHKFGGPKGVGVLYASKNTKLSPMILGGSQERGMRAGTENVALIKAMSVAAEESCRNMRTNGIKMTKLRDYIIDRLINEVPGVKLNGHRNFRLPNNINVYIEDVNGESMVVMLDSFNVYISTGSACSSRSKEPSHVLSAIGLNEKQCYESVRLTISEESTFEEALKVINYIKKIVYDIRKG